MPLGSSSAAPVTTPGPRRLERLLKDTGNENAGCGPEFRSLATEAVDDRIASLPADDARSDLHAGRRLAPLVFGVLEQAPDPAHRRTVVALGRQLLGAEVALDQPLQNRVEHGIRRQR